MIVILMESMDKDVKKTLKKHLKGITSANLESLLNRLGGLPYERVLLTTDISVALAATNLRAAVEMLRAAPEVSRLIEAGDLRIWGEIGKRLAATSVETAINFFQSSAAILDSIIEDMRSPVLRLVNKQAALSANTAVESFKAAPGIISSIGDHDTVAQVLTICLELARHSVKHSNDLFIAAPGVIEKMSAVADDRRPGMVKRALALTSSFAFRSGGTAAEFFTEIPSVVTRSDPESVEKLFEITEAYLDRSGGVALQYFKAASRVLTIAGYESFDRWTMLAKRVALQGNAASYHFMKQSPQIVADLAARAGRGRRAEVVTAVLEIVEEIAERSIIAATECFKASPLALSAATVGQFREWALRGIEKTGDNSRRIQAYYALESRASQDALFTIEGGLKLDSIAHTLKLYVEGLTGRALNISSLSSIPDESKIGDGKTIYLPSVVAEFEDESENFRLFKVLAAHAAGQVEFQTYVKETPDLHAALAETRVAFSKAKNPASDPATGNDLTPEGLDYVRVLRVFPNAELALRLFTTIENGRIDFLLRKAYRGIRRDLDFVRSRLVERRPQIESLPLEFVPFELLFQAAICGGATADARRTYPTVVREIETILSSYIFREDATVGDSLIATRHVYDFFVEQPSNADAQNDQENESPGEGEGGGGEASVADPNAEQSGERKQIEVSNDPYSFWASSQSQEVMPDQDIFNQLNAGQTAEQDLEKGDRAFYYDEWDRDLGDYRTRWCRIIERAGSRGSRGFVEMVRSRYSGVISSVRYQFQLLRPENLRRIRGEVDGEDYDLQSVINYALDKRATGLINDRLYTRKLRRERDVAVSFLLDMSSSTARTISRYPNNPYTQPGQRIIDIEKEGLVLMSEALEAVGDSYSMQGFTSEGRRNVKFYVIKDFSEGYSAEVERRIGGITYQNNTRLGAAIRHADNETLSPGRADQTADSTFRRQAVRSRLR